MKLVPAPLPRRQRFRRAPVARCSICERVRPLPYVTPDDPPFYRAGRHCWPCEVWLLTGDPIEDPDLGRCPYYARWLNLPGHDPEAICDSGCYSEPACVTNEPRGGWPSMRRRLFTDLLRRNRVNLVVEP